MSKSDRRLTLEAATEIGLRLIKLLRPGCERIEIAGSIRRKRPLIGDIEIVCIPRMTTDLIGQPVESELDPVIGELIATGMVTAPHRNGPRHKSFGIPMKGRLTFNLDLFLTTPECWGVVFAIRTGSAAYSKNLVTQRQWGGYLPNGHRVEGSRVWKGQEVLETPEEEDFFTLCGGWVPPEKREL